MSNLYIQLPRLAYFPSADKLFAHEIITDLFKLAASHATHKLLKSLANSSQLP